MMQPQRPIYLDYMSTTPVDERVVAAMQACLGYEGAYGNASSTTHAYGFEAKAWVDHARQQVADAIHADPREIIWTSGATEANNLAIQGTAHFYQRQGKHIISVETEHASVRDTLKFLQSQGFSITWLKPGRDGLLNLVNLEAAIRPDTILISTMHVNNETGVIQDIAAIGTLARQLGIKYHVDAAQSLGKVRIDLQNLPVDLMSLSAHKMYGPKGVGALYVRRQPRTRLQALIYGGGQEYGLRAGTIATHQVVGMGLACELAMACCDAEYKKITELSRALWNGLKALGGIEQNARTVHKIPHCLNVRFEGVHSDALLAALPYLAMSAGAACQSAHPEPSHVLLAMGRSRTEAQHSLRISLGRYTTADDIRYAVDAIHAEVTRLRGLSSVWKPMGVHTGCYVDECGSASEGERIEMSIQLDSLRTTIHHVEWRCAGSRTEMAACEWVCHWLQGKTLTAALDLQPAMILEGLGLSRLYIAIAVRLVHITHKIINTILK